MQQHFIRRILPAVILLAGILACAILFFTTKNCAFLFLLGGISLLCLLLSYIFSNSVLTYCTIIIVSFCITFTAVELYLRSNNYDDVATYIGGYKQQPDDVLGYGPVAKAQKSIARRLIGDRVIYDVVYTTNDQGWRVTPTHPDARNAVIFGGCSFTMGEGVNDDEAFPNQVAKALGSDWQVYNFGQGGYGPHQFLAMVEHGILDAVLQRYPHATVFFLLLPGIHESRVAGYSRWDEHGPRYVLENGEAVRRGNFDAPEGAGLGTRLWLPIKLRFQRTQIFNRLCGMSLINLDRDNMLMLEQAILRKAEARIKAVAPEARFIVMEFPLLPEQYIDGKPPVGYTPSVPLRPYFPQWPDKARYNIPEDGHPTPEAYAIVAKAVLDILRTHNLLQ